MRKHFVCVCVCGGGGGGGVKAIELLFDTDGKNCSFDGLVERGKIQIKTKSLIGGAGTETNLMHLIEKTLLCVCVCVGGGGG